MGFLLATICASTGVVLTLKFAMSRGMPADTVNFFYRMGMGVSAILGLIVTFPLTEVPSYLMRTWPFIVPGTLLLFLAGTSAINSVRRGHMGISTMVIRGSVVLPVGFSLAVLWLNAPERFFAVLPWACGGCVAVLLSFVCFGLDTERRVGIQSARGWLPWLAVAFFAHGGWDIVVAASAGLSARETYFCFCCTGLGAALISSFRIRSGMGGISAVPAIAGLTGGLLALAVSLVRPLAIKDLGGLIVFPVTAIGGMLLVQYFGALFWKHRLGRAGWIGAGFSVLGIVLLLISRESGR